MAPSRAMPFSADRHQPRAVALRPLTARSLHLPMKSPSPASALRALACALLLAVTASAAAATPPAPARLYHGAAYYPELWPETEIDRDIAEMKKLGLNVVRIGEFAWSVMEPEEGRIDLSLFRRVMDRLHAAGIDVVLCTPTATPPVWLTHGHPERLFVDSTGTPLIHGARQHVSTDHPAMRAASARIVEAMARELGRHPALVAWQIDNEFKCHVGEDFSPASVERWHAYLQQRYGTIAALNAAWGADIWSQRYQRFDQVPAPLKTPFLHNPSLSSAFALFARESVATFMDEQIAIIRRHSTAPITHNFNVGFRVNLERMLASLDFAAWDDYPNAANWNRIVFQSDFFRSTKPERPFWLMETSPAHNGWIGNNREISHPPGYLRVEAVAAYALGAEAFNYWLWRQQRTGAELPHAAVLQSWGTPSIGYAEVAAVEAARRELEPLLTQSRPAPAEIALTWSDRGRVMLTTEALGQTSSDSARCISYGDILNQWHRRLLDLGYHREFRLEGQTLDGLKVLVTPAMMAVDDAFLARVQPWVEAGGTWIIAPLTGTRTPEHTAPVDAGLGHLDALAGVESVFGFPVTLTGATGRAFDVESELTGWCMALKPRDTATKVVGTIRGGSADGLAFVTERTVGRGRIVLIGAEPLPPASGETIYDRLVRHYAAAAGVAPLADKATGLLLAPRLTADGKRLLLAINMEGKPAAFTLKAAARDTLANAAVPAGPLTLPAYSYRVLTLD